MGSSSSAINTTSIVLPLIFIVVGIVIVALAIVFTVRRSSSRKGLNVTTQRLEFEQRQAMAIPASATVVSAQVVVHYPSQNRRVMHLQLSVTPPGGKPYFANSNWVVDETALAYLQPGTELAVKIDTQNPNIVYPNTGWASFSLGV